MLDLPRVKFHEVKVFFCEFCPITQMDIHCHENKYFNKLEKANSTRKGPKYWFAKAKFERKK